MDVLIARSTLKFETKKEIPLHLHMMRFGCLLYLGGSEEVDEKLIAQVGVDEDPANFVVKELLVHGKAGYFWVDVGGQMDQTVFASKKSEVLLEIGLVSVKMFGRIPGAVRIFLDDSTHQLA